VRELLAHAAQLGVSVHIAHLPAPYRGYYEPAAERIVLDFNLTPIEKREVLAHELGHVYHGHQCENVKAQEDDADIYAVRLLIDPSDYAALEMQNLPLDAIAEELRVPQEYVSLFQAHALTRLRGVTYAAARLGRAQYRHAWA
jgi:Zn-dependent peptidase ImmA (M78 family)